MLVWGSSQFSGQKRRSWLELGGSASEWADRFRSILPGPWWAGEVQIWSAACRQRNLAPLLRWRLERWLGTRSHIKVEAGEGLDPKRICGWLLIGFGGGLGWFAAAQRRIFAAMRLGEPWGLPDAGGYCGWSFSDGLCWRVEFEDDRVGLWSQMGECSVRPSGTLMVGRRRLLLVVLTESSPIWPRDGRELAEVRLQLWGPSDFRVDAEWGYGRVLQMDGPGVPSPVMLRLLFCLLLFCFVLGSQSSNKSILYGVMVVVVDLGNWIDLGCWLVIRIQSYLVFVLGFYYQPVLRRKGDPGIARPIVFYWLVPILVFATYFGPICASSGSIRSWLLDPLTRHYLFVGVRICVVSSLMSVLVVNPDGSVFAV